MNGGADIFDAEFFDEQIRGEIAADGDHQFAKLAKRAGMPLGFIEIGFGIDGGIELEDGAVGDGMKFVVDSKRCRRGATSLPWPDGRVRS